MVDKKIERKSSGLCLNIGFWSMLALFVIMLLLTLFKLQWPSLIAGVLFIISVFFVFVTSIRMLAPEGKSMAYIALGIAIMFILYLLFAITFSATSTGVLG